MGVKRVCLVVLFATIGATCALLYRHPVVCCIPLMVALLLKCTQALKRQQLYLPEFTETCLGCICDASSACNFTIGCYAGLCGPFLIRKQYWIDAGAPVLPGATLQSPQAYETCANDPTCAVSTIFSYMSRYKNDCNYNGVLDCDDYARIHFLGGNQCDIPIHNYAYYRVFHQCWSKVQLASEDFK